MKKDQPVLFWTDIVVVAYTTERPNMVLTDKHICTQMEAIWKGTPKQLACHHVQRFRHHWSGIEVPSAPFDTRVL